MRGKDAFTVLELLLTLTILSIIAMLAIPLLTDYVARAKESEAGLNLRKIYDGQIAYYHEEFVTKAGDVVPKQFLALPPTPSIPLGKRQYGNFGEGNWHLISFENTSPVYFSYSVVARGTGDAAAFTARAVGDFDEDGFRSLFERVGVIDPVTRDVVGGGALFIANELQGLAPN